MFSLISAALPASLSDQSISQLVDEQYLFSILRSPHNTRKEKKTYKDYFSLHCRMLRPRMLMLLSYVSGKDELNWIDETRGESGKSGI